MTWSSWLLDAATNTATGLECLCTFLSLKKKMFKANTKHLCNWYKSYQTINYLCNWSKLYHTIKKLPCNWFQLYQMIKKLTGIKHFHIKCCKRNVCILHTQKSKSKGFIILLVSFQTFFFHSFSETDFIKQHTCTLRSEKRLWGLWFLPPHSKKKSVLLVGNNHPKCDGGQWTPGRVFRLIFETCHSVDLISWLISNQFDSKSISKLISNSQVDASFL